MISLQTRVPDVVDDFSSLKSLNPKSLIIFGGTFDPPHIGHYQLAKAIAERADLVVIMPAAQNPLKEKGPLASSQQRVDMLKLLFENEPKIVVSRVEILRVENSRSPSYMIDTVEQAVRELPGCRVSVAIGQDWLPELNRWKNWDKIFELANFIPIARAGTEKVDFDLLVQRLGEDNAKSLKNNFIDHKIEEISSTKLRAWLSSGDSQSAKYLSSKVSAYISQHSLYRNS